MPRTRWQPLNRIPIVEVPLNRVPIVEVPLNRVPIVGVPRNFATGHLLAMVTLFALVFSFLAYQEAGHEWYVLWGLFIASIILGQMVLFGGKNPRVASCVVGACEAPILLVGMLIVEEGSELVRNGWIELPLVLIGYVMPAACVGMGLGYLVGTVCAGVFLVSEHKWDAGKIITAEPIVAEVVREGDETQESGLDSEGSADGDPWSKP